MSGMKTVDNPSDPSLEKTAPAEEGPASQQPTNPMPADIEPVKMSKKTKLLSLVVVMMVLLLGAGAFAIRAITAPDPEKIFYETVENHMSLKYIGQHYKTESPYMNIDNDTFTDFSNPAKPKTKMSLAYKVGDKTMIQTDLVTFGTYAEYGRFTKIDDSLIKSSPTGSIYKDILGHWIKAETAEEAYMLDSSGRAGSINMTQGEFLVGNYPASLRAELAKEYKTTKVFSFNVKDVKSEKINGKRTLKYIVTINPTALKKVNQKAEDKLGLPRTYTANMPSNKMTVWIDTSTKHPVRITGEAYGSKSILDFTYPNTVDITRPNATKTVTDLNLLSTSPDSQ